LTHSQITIFVGQNSISVGSNPLMAGAALGAERNRAERSDDGECRKGADVHGKMKINRLGKVELGI